MAIQIKVLGISLLAFFLPVAAVAVVNWEEVRPYLIGDPEAATGTVLYFTAPG